MVVDEWPMMGNDGFLMMVNDGLDWWPTMVDWWLMMLKDGWLMVNADLPLWGLQGRRQHAGPPVAAEPPWQEAVVLQLCWWDLECTCAWAQATEGSKAARAVADDPLFVAEHGDDDLCPGWLGWSLRQYECWMDSKTRSNEGSWTSSTRTGPWYLRWLLSCTCTLDSVDMTTSTTGSNTTRTQEVYASPSSPWTRQLTRPGTCTMELYGRQFYKPLVLAPLLGSL